MQRPVDGEDDSCTEEAVAGRNGSDDDEGDASAEEVSVLGTV